MELPFSASAVSRQALTARYAMPGYLLGIYASLFIALGWFAHQRWQEKPPVAAVHPIATSLAQAAPEKAQTAPHKIAAVVTPPLRPIEVPAKAPQRVEGGRVPPITYSAHVFTSDPAQRSITLNGTRYREGESPMEGLVIEQIEQDATLFDVNGDVFILDSLSDWPGGKITSAEIH